VLEVWELAGQWQRVSEIRLLQERALDYALGMPNALLVATALGVGMWQISNRMYQRYLVRRDGTQALALIETPDGGFRLAVGYRHGSVLLYTFQQNLTRAGKDVALNRLEGSVLHLQWAAGGQVLLGASAGEIALWRPPEPAPVQRIPIEGIATSIRLAPSGDVLAIATPHTVRLWATPLRRLLETPTAHLAGRDLEWLEDQPRNDGDIGAWVEFIRLLTQHHIRYDIDLEFDLPVFSVGEYDIEIEVEAP
ncbi:MAG: hypothetical protein RQ971_02320, partial [Armatimonadota bacterium]|nr:hypothetical protein [Armatimonadota bacterium]